ncbi:MAG TPA: AsmA family protein [Verrucomicrobiae bacterium]|nr:AsmA family protein [Verrucomicrobiae bacterium]
MKKWLLRIVVVIVVLLVVAVVAIGLFLDSGIKKGVETFGPKLTQVSIKLDSVSVSLLSGGGKIKGLEVGNPAGYKAPTAIKLGSASLSLQPGSLLSDKIVIKSIVVESPEITIEGGPKNNNLTKILDNVEAATGGSSTTTNATAASQPSKKLEVDEFILTGAKVNYAPPGLGGKTIPLVIPDIKLTDLGTGPDGITAGDLIKRVMSELTGKIAPVLAEEVGKLGKEALGTAGDTAGKAAGEASKTLKSVTDIFKKK